MVVEKARLPEELVFILVLLRITTGTPVGARTIAAPLPSAVVVQLLTSVQLPPVFRSVTPVPAVRLYTGRIGLGSVFAVPTV